MKSQEKTLSKKKIHLKETTGDDQKIKTKNFNNDQRKYQNKI